MQIIKSEWYKDRVYIYIYLSIYIKPLNDFESDVNINVESNINIINTYVCVYVYREYEWMDNELKNDNVYEPEQSFFGLIIITSLWSV